MAKWKPKVGETYYAPWLIDYEVDCIDIVWNDFPWDEVSYNAGVVCRTEEEAYEVALKWLNKEVSEDSLDDILFSILGLPDTEE